MAEKKLDKKFYGEIYKVKNDIRVADDQYLVFLAKDNAFANILPLYLQECYQLGCDEEQIQAVKIMIKNVFNWREENSFLCKNPDAKGEKLL